MAIKLSYLIISTSEYKKIKDLPGDSIYVRALFDRDEENEDELSFKKDDILYVDNTLYNGILGVWRAWLIAEDGNKSGCGTIPSKSRYSGHNSNFYIPDN